jgi:hypothetical protein
MTLREHDVSSVRGVEALALRAGPTIGNMLNSVFKSTSLVRTTVSPFNQHQLTSRFKFASSILYLKECIPTWTMDTILDRTTDYPIDVLQHILHAIMAGSRVLNKFPVLSQNTLLTLFKRVHEERGTELKGDFVCETLSFLSTGHIEDQELCQCRDTVLKLYTQSVLSWIGKDDITFPSEQVVKILESFGHLFSQQELQSILNQCVASLKGGENVFDYFTVLYHIFKCLTQSDMTDSDTDTMVVPFGTLYLQAIISKFEENETTGDYVSSVLEALGE